MSSILTITRQRRHRRDQIRSSAQQRSQRTVLGFGFVVSAAVVTLVLTAALAYASLTRGLPPLEQLTLLLNPQDGQLLQPTRLYDRTGQHLIGTLSPTDSDRTYISYAQFPQTLVDATLTVTQPDFWTSPGYAIKGWQDPQAHPTLAQRLVYDLLLWDQPPSTLRSIHERMLAAQVMAQAAENAGAPHGLISCIQQISLPGTHELMTHSLTAIILATGGTPMVRAAHSTGKPAYGVGPGNVPVYVDRSADIAKAARYIVASKAFDYSTICATEQAVIADAPIARKLEDLMKAQGAYFVNPEQAELLRKMLFFPDGSINPASVGKSPFVLAGMAGSRPLFAHNSSMPSIVTIGAPPTRTSTVRSSATSPACPVIATAR